MMLRLLLRRFRKFLSFLSEAWNFIFHILMILLHLLFQLKSHKYLHRKIDIRLNLFCLFINYIMEELLILTWAVPEFHRIVVVPYEGLFKFLRNKQCLNLIWMNRRVEYFFCCIYGIGNNNNMFNVG